MRLSLMISLCSTGVVCSGSEGWLDDRDIGCGTGRSEPRVELGAWADRSGDGEYGKMTETTELHLDEEPHTGCGHSSVQDCLADRRGVRAGHGEVAGQVA